MFLSICPRVLLISLLIFIHCGLQNFDSKNSKDDGTFFNPENLYNGVWCMVMDDRCVQYFSFFPRNSYDMYLRYGCRCKNIYFCTKQRFYRYIILDKLGTRLTQTKISIIMCMLFEYSCQKYRITNTNFENSFKTF